MPKNAERSELHEILIQAFLEMLEYTEKQGEKHSKNTFEWNRNNIAAFADELVLQKEKLEKQYTHDRGAPFGTKSFETDSRSYRRIR